MSGRQPLQHLVDDVRLVRRHAGGRLVEQEHARLERQRDGDLEQPLLTIGDLRDAPVGDLDESRSRAAAASAFSRQSRHCLV